MANDLLRMHVTRVGFDLSLGKTHIAALVWIEELRVAKWDATYFRKPKSGPMHRAFNNLVSGFHGLEERGLVVHRYDPQQVMRFQQSNPVHRDEDGVLRIHHNPKVWKITKAGRLVIDLLKESGLYDEYAGQIRPRDNKGVDDADSQGREAS